MQHKDVYDVYINTLSERRLLYNVLNKYKC